MKLASLCIILSILSYQSLAKKTLKKKYKKKHRKVAPAAGAVASSPALPPLGKAVPMNQI